MRPATHLDQGSRPPGPGRSGLTRARVPEETIHRAVVDVLARAAMPDIAWTHMPAGEARAKGVAGKLKGMGVKAGWPDLLIVKGGRLYGLELKTESGRGPAEGRRGRLSPAQVAAHAVLRAAGAEVAVAYGLDAALDQLAHWGVLRVAGAGKGVVPEARLQHDVPEARQREGPPT